MLDVNCTVSIISQFRVLDCLESLSCPELPPYLISALILIDCGKGLDHKLLGLNPCTNETSAEVVKYLK